MLYQKTYLFNNLPVSLGSLFNKIPYNPTIFAWNNHASSSEVHRNLHVAFNVQYPLKLLRIYMGNNISHIHSCRFLSSFC